MRNKSDDYKADLLKDLRDADYSAGYITAAYEESYETYLLALRNVAEAQQGMQKIASETGLNRENLYRMLSRDGNPRQSSIYSVVDTLGFEVKFTAKTPNRAIASGGSPRKIIIENSLATRHHKAKKKSIYSTNSQIQLSFRFKDSKHITIDAPI